MTIYRIDNALADAPVCYFPEVDSTMRVARELIAGRTGPGREAADVGGASYRGGSGVQGGLALRHGLVIAAGHQSGGEGRGAGSSWTAPRDSALLVSIVLEAPPDATLSIRAGLAVARMLRRRVGVPAHVKWPNDVLLGEGKVCGVLPEWRSGWAIVGIGLNVHAAPVLPDPQPKEPGLDWTESREVSEADRSHSRPSDPRPVAVAEYASLAKLPTDPLELLPPLLAELSVLLRGPFNPTAVEGVLAYVGRRVMLVEPDGRGWSGRFVRLSERGGAVLELDVREGGCTREFVAGRLRSF